MTTTTTDRHRPPLRLGGATANGGSARPAARCTCSWSSCSRSTSLSVLIALLSTGAGLIVLVIGLPLLALSLLVARGFGVADRYLLRLTGLPGIPEPTWNRDAARPETGSG